MRFQQTVDPVAILADEYRRLSWFGRMLVWCASPRMAKAARYLAANGPTYVNVPVMHAQQRQDGPVTKAVDGWFAGSSHR